MADTAEAAHRSLALSTGATPSLSSHLSNCHLHLAVDLAVTERRTILRPDRREERVARQLLLDRCPLLLIRGLPQGLLLVLLAAAVCDDMMSVGT
jgi:hypothetical protein